MGFNNYPYPSYAWSYQGFDFAGMPNISQSLANDMYADGVRFVGRYLWPSHYPNGKGLSAAEADFYLNAGISIYLYYEVDSTDALQGYQHGVDNGQAALAEATAIGVPVGTQVYCCCDTGVTDQQAASLVMGYLEGFRDGMPGYNVGIYGGSNVMAACYDTFPDLYRCQAGAWGMQEFDPIDVRQWLLSYNNRAQSDGLIQIANVTIDQYGYAFWRGVNVDLCSAPDLNNMWGNGTPVPPTPPGPPTHKTDMPLWFYLKMI